MMKRILTLALAMIMLAAVPAGMSAARTWEPLKTEMHELKSVAKDPEIEIKAGSGHLVVSANRQVQIKIFSILGQLISSDPLPAGTHRLSGTPHGVYIIKAGDLTCKVVI